jgi:hypothetical protein
MAVEGFRKYIVKVGESRVNPQAAIYGGKRRQLK